MTQAYLEMWRHNQPFDSHNPGSTHAPKHRLQGVAAKRNSQIRISDPYGVYIVWGRKQQTYNSVRNAHGLHLGFSY